MPHDLLNPLMALLIAGGRFGLQALAIPLLNLAPMLAPIAESAYGLDPIHIGVVMVFNIMIGQFTPPIGLSLFVMRDITGFSLGRVFRAVLPFLGPLLISLLIMAFVPSIVTAIPSASGC